VKVDGNGTLDASGVTQIASGVTNAGHIELQPGTLTLSGTVANTGGTIESLQSAAALDLNGATIAVGGNVNISTGDKIDAVKGVNEIDSALTNAGTVQVDSGATLTLGHGGASTVANTGTIEANGGTLAINGNVTGTGVIEALSGGTIDLQGRDRITGGTVIVDLNRTLDAAGMPYITSALTNAGTVKVDSQATLTLAGTVANIGTLEVNNNGTLAIKGTVTGTGTAVINGNGTLDLFASFGESVTFRVDAQGDHSGVLKLENPSQFHGSVSGFASGHVIDLVGFGKDALIANYSNGKLLVIDAEPGDNGHPAIANIAIVGSSTLTAASFHGSVVSGGYEIHL
jgi:hypothetical protein